MPKLTKAVPGEKMTNGDTSINKNWDPEIQKLLNQCYRIAIKRGWEIKNASPSADSKIVVKKEVNEGKKLK